MDATATGAPVAFADALRVWLRVGLLGFGGPAGQIALLHRMVVEERRWIDEPRFLHALNYCMLLPGPEAQQLATYLGWLLHGVRGGVAAGVLFVLPGALLILALSAGYAAYHELALVASVFFGVKAAVLALVIDACHRVGKRALRNAVTIAIALGAFVAIAVFAVDFPIVVGAAALIGLATRNWTAVPREPDRAQAAPDARAARRAAWLFALLWLTPVAALLIFAGGSVFTDLALFFSKTAIVTFGGAYAVLAYVGREAVTHYGWLAPGEMLDGLGLAESTPGPLILVLGFVGYLAGGVAGWAITLFVTFTPSFLWIFAGAPYVERLRGNRAIGAALAAITAAVVGVIASLALWFGLHVLFAQTAPVTGWGISMNLPAWASLDPVALALAAGAAVALIAFRAPLLIVLGACAGLGAIAHLAI